MLPRRVFLDFPAGLTVVFLTTGCFGNKNQDVATAPPPPPAAYPDTSAAAGGVGATAPGAMGGIPAMTSGPAVAASTSRGPAPFALREGEQLVPHQIQSGENLSSIAAKYNSSISRIQAANGMTDTKIFAGKTLQVPTSAPPVNLAQNQAGGYPASAPAPAAVSPAYSGGGGNPYPSTTGAPGIPNPGVPSSPSPTYPATSGTPGAISPPPVPQSPGLPGYPASTSYPRTSPTPSFEASRIQFSN